MSNVLELRPEDRVDPPPDGLFRAWLPRPGYQVVRTYPRYGYAEVPAPGLRAWTTRLCQRLRWSRR